MARIAGVDLPKDKRIEIGLTYVYGIGRTSAKKILDMTGINPDTRVKDLTDEEEAKIRECIDHNFIVEGDLRRQTALDIKRLTEIGCYRGLRHRKGLPVRGQRRNGISSGTAVKLIFLMVESQFCGGWFYWADAAYKILKNFVGGICLDTVVLSPVGNIVAVCSQ